MYLRDVRLALGSLLVLDKVEGRAGEVMVRVQDTNIAMELVVHHLLVRKGSDSGDEEADEGLDDGEKIHGGDYWCKKCRAKLKVWEVVGMKEGGCGRIER